MVYANMNGSVDRKLGKNGILYDIIYNQLHQPDIVVFTEIKDQASQGRKFTNLDGYIHYNVPPRKTMKGGKSNGMRIMISFKCEQQWYITKITEYIIVIEHKTVRIVIIVVYLVPPNEENKKIVYELLIEFKQMVINYRDNEYDMAIIGDTNGRMGDKTGDKKKNKRGNWLWDIVVILYLHIVNNDEWKGVPTWFRNDASAIIDYVIVPYENKNNHSMKLYMLDDLSDHAMIYWEGTFNKNERKENKKMSNMKAIYPKWQFRIAKPNEENKEQTKQMMVDIENKWNKWLETGLMENVTVNKITSIFKLVYKIIWDAAIKNGMCKIKRLSKRHNEKDGRRNGTTDERIVRKRELINKIMNEKATIYRSHGKLNENSIKRMTKLSNEINKLRNDIKHIEIVIIDELLESKFKKYDKLDQFYELLKQNNNYATYGIINEKENILCNKIDIMGELEKFFCRLFNDPKRSNMSDEQKEQIRKQRKRLIEKAKIAITQMNSGIGKYQLNEDNIDDMFRKYNIKGATTINGINLKIWKTMWESNKARTMVFQILNVVFKFGLFSEMDTISITTNIPKKINSDTAKKYRPITMNPDIVKFVCCLHLNATRINLFKNINQSQGGTQEHLSHNDQTSQLLIAIKNNGENGNPTSSGGMDIAKAFDSIIWEIMINELEKESNMKGVFLLLILTIYLTATIVLKLACASTVIYGTIILITNGIFQGNSQSAPFYTIANNAVVKEFHHLTQHMPCVSMTAPESEKWKEYMICDEYDMNIIQAINTVIRFIMIIFVDDTTIITTSPQMLEKILNIFTEVSGKKGLKINDDKTQVVIFNKKLMNKNDKKWLKDNNNTIKINNVKIKIKKQMKMLGFIHNTMDKQFQHNWETNIIKAEKAWKYLVHHNYIIFNMRAIERNITLIETKLRPILDNGTAIAPLNSKYMVRYNKIVDSWYKKVLILHKSASNTSCRLIGHYQSAFERSTYLQMGYYHRMITMKKNHKTVNTFRMDVAKCYDYYQEPTPVSTPFSIDYTTMKRHTEYYLKILDKLKLGEYKKYKNINDVSKQQWKTIVKKRIYDIQATQDRFDIALTRNMLLKMKIDKWGVLQKKNIIYKLISSNEEYNTVIWQVLTNNIQLNWKRKNSIGILQYSYPRCIFCKYEWHMDITPIRHLMEQCEVIKNKLNIKFNNGMKIEEIYKKWNLLAISQLATLLQPYAKYEKV